MGARVHYIYKACVTGTIPSQTETTTIPSHGYVMTLLQLLMVYKLGEDKLHRAPVVALNLGSVNDTESDASSQQDLRGS